MGEPEYCSTKEKERRRERNEKEKKCYDGVVVLCRAVTAAIAFTSSFCLAYLRRFPLRLPRIVVVSKKENRNEKNIQPVYRPSFALGDMYASGGPRLPYRVKRPAPLCPSHYIVTDLSNSNPCSSEGQVGQLAEHASSPSLGAERGSRLDDLAALVQPLQH